MGWGKLFHPNHTYNAPPMKYDNIHSSEPPDPSSPTSNSVWYHLLYAHMLIAASETYCTVLHFHRHCGGLRRGKLTRIKARNFASYVRREIRRESSQNNNFIQCGRVAWLFSITNPSSQPIFTTTVPPHPTTLIPTYIRTYSPVSPRPHPAHHHMNTEYSVHIPPPKCHP